MTASAPAASMAVDRFTASPGRARSATALWQADRTASRVPRTWAGESRMSRTVRSPSASSSAPARTSSDATPWQPKCRSSAGIAAVTARWVASWSTSGRAPGKARRTAATSSTVPGIVPAPGRRGTATATAEVPGPSGVASRASHSSPAACRSAGRLRSNREMASAVVSSDPAGSGEAANAVLRCSGAPAPCGCPPGPAPEAGTATGRAAAPSAGVPGAGSAAGLGPAVPRRLRARRGRAPRAEGCAMCGPRACRAGARPRSGRRRRTATAWG